MGSVVVLKADFDWFGSEDLLARCNLESGGRVQQAIDNAVIRYCMPYIPFKTGTLAQSAYVESDIGKGRVAWGGPSAPYAAYQYFGEIYGPNIPFFEDDSGVPTKWRSKKGQKKHPTGRRIHYDTSLHAQAGSHWFDRMKADHMQDILREARDVAGVK